MPARCGLFLGSRHEEELHGQEAEALLVNLKSAIAARGLRQVDLALELKIAPSVLSEIVNGRRQAEDSLRARLSQLLQADEAWLFSRITRIPAPSPLAVAENA
jgi:transcriptional regulator with XRE-family HTH domain